jgi:hypothetical protein
VIVLNTKADGFSPDSESRTWPWWQDDEIIQRSNPFIPEQKDNIPVKSGPERTVLRFLAVDEDGGYFKEGSDGSYGSIDRFIGSFIEILGDDENLFDVVQATDENGNRRFSLLPYYAEIRVPVLEIRFKSHTDKVLGRSYSLIVKVKDDAKPDKLLAGVAVKFGFFVEEDQSVGQSADNAGQTAGARGDIGVLGAAWNSEELPVPLSASMAADMM